MEDFAYPVILVAADEGGFDVRFPDVPEAFTQGDDEEEALARAQDALETALEFYIDDRKALPVPTKAKRGQRTVQPAVVARMKLSVYTAMIETKIRKSDLARQLGWHLMQIDRLIDLHHASRIDQIDAALRAMGRKLSITVEKAA